jgi:hypothetical protein
VVSPSEMARAKRSIATSSHSDIRRTQLPAPGPHFAAARFHVMQILTRQTPAGKCRKLSPLRVLLSR